MSYTRVNWQNSPNTATPLSAENLNKMDAGIKQNADDIEQLQQHTYDEELDGTSTNAPQTKAVYEALQQINVETDPTLTVSGKPADAAATGEAIADVKSAIDALKITDTASGAIASFPDGAAMPVESLTVEMSPIQEGTGDPSPDNIRPITGRDAVTVVRYNGKNVFNPNANPSKWIDANGNIISSDANSSVSDKIYVNSSITQACIYIRTTDAEGVLLIAAYDRNDKLLLRKAGSGTRYVSMESIPQDTHYLLFAKYRTAPPVCGVLNTLSNSPFYEYTDDALLTVTISLGQTVYGGTVDVTTGMMMVDRAMVTLDGTNAWTMFSEGKFFVNNVTSDAATITERYVSNQYPFAGYGNTQSNAVTIDKRFYGQRAFNRIWVYDSQYTTLDTFKAALSATPLQVVYPFDTPVEITLAPAQLSTLHGQNNVWSDADSVTVDYVCDPKLYIARLTEPDADMVADANITSGKYFMVGNTLYLATANIASGATIVPGVNCTKTNLSSALNAINA